MIFVQRPWPVFLRLFVRTTLTDGLLADSGINIEKEVIRSTVMDALIEALEAAPCCMA